MLKSLQDVGKIFTKTLQKNSLTCQHKILTQLHIKIIDKNLVDDVLLLFRWPNKFNDIFLFGIIIVYLIIGCYDSHMYSVKY